MQTPAPPSFPSKQKECSSALRGLISAPASCPFETGKAPFESHTKSRKRPYFRLPIVFAKYTTWKDVIAHFEAARRFQFTTLCCCVDASFRRIVACRREICVRFGNAQCCVTFQLPNAFQRVQQVRSFSKSFSLLIPFTIDGRRWS